MDWKFDDREHHFENHSFNNPTYIKHKLKLIIDSIKDPWYRQFPSNGRQSFPTFGHNGNQTVKLITFDTTVEGNLIECICFLQF